MCSTRTNLEPGSACPNCGHAIAGKYCAECGQETSPPPALREILRDTIMQLLSFESKAWQTFAKLVAAPGSLTSEYFAGRRARYIRPLRLYLWVSVLTISITEIFGLHLGLRLPGDEGIYLFDTASYLGTTQENTGFLSPMHFVLEHVETPGLARFKSMSLEAQTAYILQRRHQILKYFMLLLVPVFAFVLQACYRDRQRRFPDYLVFCLHSQSFLLIALVVEALLPTPLALLVSAWVVAYYFIALRHVFRAGWAMTALRGGAAVVLDFMIFFATGALLVLALLEL